MGGGDNPSCSGSGKEARPGRRDDERGREDREAEDQLHDEVDEVKQVVQVFGRDRTLFPSVLRIFAPSSGEIFPRSTGSLTSGTKTLL
jgi:hypothetical protein